MSARIQIRRRVNSGNIPNPELQQQRIADMQAKREVFCAVVASGIGFVAFLVMAAAIYLTH